MEKILIVVVNWNTATLLEQCLESIFAYAPSQRFRVCVVDNGSTDDSLRIARTRFRTVSTIPLSQNRGFTYAFNYATSLFPAEYVLSLHPDTQVTPGAIDTLQGYLDVHPGVAAVGPKHVYPNGDWNRSCFRFPTLYTEFCRAFWLHGLFPRSRRFTQTVPVRPGATEIWQPDKEQEVDWLGSSCMMLRRRALNEVGPLDERFFVWWGDVDWCYRARSAGWAIAYMPRAQIIHYEMQTFKSLGTTAQGKLAYKEKGYLVESKVRENAYYFFKKNYGTLQARLLRIILTIQYVNKIVACLILALFFQRKREEAKQRIVNYWQALRGNVMRYEHEVNGRS